MNVMITRPKFKVCMMAGLILIPSLISAQANTETAIKGTPSQIPQFFFEPSNYLWALVIGLTLAVFMALSKTVKVLAYVVSEKKEQSVTSAVKEKSKHDSSWNKLMKALTRSVPVEQEADVMLDHDYDGIRELDNRLPPWWVWSFYATILFSIVYLVHYHVSGTGLSQAEEYNRSIHLAELEKENRMKNSANFITEANVTRLSDPVILNEGKALYDKHCVACHGNAGQGGVGPNLTDAYWIHGGGIRNVFRVISEGVPAQGMIAWKSQLSPKQMQALSSYILTMEGTNPPNPKDRQGEKWEEPVEQVIADTVQSNQGSSL